MDDKNLDALAEKVSDLIVEARKVVVFTGAGVSTESGIPDFRGPDGLWTKFDPEDFTIDKFLRSAETRRQQWRILSGELITGEAKPNLAHYAIADLHRLGKLDCVITQNVDNLHQAAGVPDAQVFELHGNMRRVVCLRCRRVYLFEKIKARLARGEDSLDCEVCHGILKPDVVFFGEPLPERIMEEATVHASNGDLFLVIGSSLVVYPAAYMPGYAVEGGAKLVIINLSPTPMDDRAAIVIRARAGEAMTKIVEKVKGKLHAKTGCELVQAVDLPQPINYNRVGFKRKNAKMYLRGGPTLSGRRACTLASAEALAQAGRSMRYGTQAWQSQWADRVTANKE